MVRLNILLVVVISCMLVVFSCNSSTKEVGQTSTKKKLPKIGHYDIVYEAENGYEVGDTIFHTVPDWTYLNQDSVIISSDSISDKIWIVDFIFSHCPNICSPMTERMKQVNASLSEYQDKILFLTFTIDPKRDSLSRLREYRKEHEITASNWHFLRGEQEATNQMAFDGFQIFAKEDDKAPGGFAHSSNFVLVDTNGFIRGVYDGLNDQQRGELVEDVKWLLTVD